MDIKVNHVDPSIFQFSANFCKELDKSINFVSSPLVAAEIMMSMMDLGSFDTTGPLFSNCIQIINGSNIPYSFLSLSPCLNSIKGVTLKRASKVYLKKNYYKLNRYTKKAAAEVFNVKVEKIDFSKRVEAAKCINKWLLQQRVRQYLQCSKPQLCNGCVNAFNALSPSSTSSNFANYNIPQTKCVAWPKLDMYLNNMKVQNAFVTIEKETKKKIKGNFDFENFDVNTHIVLVSCLYFKGIWQMKFDPDDTEETIFHLNNNETVNVFLMYRKEKYKYKDSIGLDAQMVLLPFKDEQAQMLIILPHRITGLDDILQNLANGYDLLAEMSHMHQNHEIIVSIPRFTIQSEINLTKVFHELGINTAIDKAVQKVLIKVNEEGTEPKLDPRRGGFIPRWKPRPIEFIANRPHLIVILCHNIPIIWVTFRGRFE